MSRHREAERAAGYIELSYIQRLMVCTHFPCSFSKREATWLEGTGKHFVSVSGLQYCHFCLLHDIGDIGQTSLMTPNYFCLNITEVNTKFLPQNHYNTKCSPYWYILNQCLTDKGSK